MLHLCFLDLSFSCFLWFPMYDYSSRPAFLDILIFLLEHRFLFTVGKIATGTTVDFVGWVWLYQTGYQD